ncbi:MAG: DUF2007 domain-containing protein [Verrucomicrobiales bacterium]|nr:DUF2007 domain-containing protein [Verrucomicrobiales bacterium]
MKSVFMDVDSTRVGYAQSLLEAAGISCFVRNATSQALIGASLTGALRLFDPELCVWNDADHAEAVHIVLAALGPGENGPDWLCPACGEMAPHAHDSCWNCQHPRG